MKILLLSDLNSIHTINWAISLKKESNDIYVFGLMECNSINKTKYDANSIRVESMNFKKEKFNFTKSHFSKALYLLSIFKIKKIIKFFEPDIMHAHYASSYGILGMLCNFQPFVLSVWGTDIYEFPKNSKLNKLILKKILKSSCAILSTSKSMSKEVKKIINKSVYITPFGIDTDIFIPRKASIKENFTVIGTIKSLEDQYGIDLLIKAFKIVVENIQNKKLKLLIVGEGNAEIELKQLVNKLQLNDFVNFYGYVRHEDIVTLYQNIDIYVALSRRESYGVALLEASSCSIPVIASNVGGIPEVVKHNSTGILVKSEDIEQAVQAMHMLIENEDLRKSLGENGREYVKNNFEKNKCIYNMINIYNKILNKEIFDEYTNN